MCNGHTITEEVISLYPRWK